MFSLRNVHFSRLHGEWLVILTLCLASVWALHDTPWVQRFNGLLYDNVLKWQASPSNPDIVIVEIDDHSLRSLGAWPWPRHIQARLLNQLTLAKPKAVALDILFSEASSDPAQDEQLRQALAHMKTRGTAVYLPIAALETPLPGQPMVLGVPIVPLRQAVSGLGHIHVQLDADGIARKINLWEGLAQEPLWPSLSWQMFATGRDTQPQEQRWLAKHVRTPLPRLAQWHTQAPILLPYSGGIGHYPSVSYVDVLNGQVPSKLLENKYIFVGMTAIGVGDHYPTPVTKDESLMPGVQINATALDALLQETWIQPATTTQVLAPTVAFLVAWMLALWKMGPRTSTPALMAGLIGLLLTSTCLQVLWRIHWPAGLSLMASLLAYVLWNWRRLSVLVSQIRTYAKNDGHKQGNNIALEPPGAASALLRYDGWQPLLEALQTGLNQELGQKNLLSNTLQAMPEAVLLTDAAGRILLANARAHQLIQLPLLTGQNALSDIGLFGQPALMTWQEGMQKAQSIQGLEWVYTPRDNAQAIALLLRSHGVMQWADIEQAAKPLLSATELANASTTQSVAGWIVTLVDISWQKQLQQQRDQALQLLSHDFRAPQSALLTLIRQHRSLTEQSPPNTSPIDHRKTTDWLDQLQLQVQTSLKLADDFVWLLRAQDVQYQHQDIEIAALLQQVMDRAWPLAQAKNIQISPQLIEGTQDAIWMQADANLLERAFFNLVENAIKYSPADTRVTLKIQTQSAYQQGAGAPLTPEPDQCVQVTITDQGYGIAAEDLPTLFDRYSRFEQPKRKDSTSGHGLGLALVRNVIAQHGGTIQCSSQEGQGTRFVITLPITPFITTQRAQSDG